MGWQSGDQIVLRYAGDWGGDRITWVLPVTVVRDEPDCIALYLAAGTPIKSPADANGDEIPRDLPFEERYKALLGMRESTWHTNARLMLARPGSAHLISLFWMADDWRFLGWYVDFQAPFRRTAIGFDSQDYVLDIVVAPDLSWAWKDEDEFADTQRIGRFTPSEAQAIRDEGERVIAGIESRSWPYSEDWELWRPDPGWSLPALPSKWRGA